jgi:hypothetical protein
MRRFLTGAGVIMIVFALVLFYLSVTAKRHPHADFDVTGLLWIMQNSASVGGIIIAFALFAFGAGAIAKARSGRLSALDDATTNARFMAEFGPLRKKAKPRDDQEG